MKMLTKDDLVAAVGNLGGASKVVSSDDLKKELVRGGFDVGFREDGTVHGWRIRKAEDDELAAANPRLKKWWRTSGRKIVGFTLAKGKPSSTGWSAQR